ncbi:MAG: dephospho-CoA kinase [Spirochaetes bacterium GWB1_59_5]|nr:MAG: dephospho-CoA kinase [Spirochaetes bacterium GWB1_59_5]
MILGLTGGYCSGKSSAASLLKAAGWVIVDVDALGHAALERSTTAVAALLGRGALKVDGSPDRRAIGALVFADAGLLASYEAIVHPAMNKLVAEAVAAAGDRVCVDAALLYRLPVAAACDAIIELRSPLLARLRRGKARDGLGARAVLARIARQKPLWAEGRAYVARVAVLRNCGSKERLDRKMLAIIRRMESSLGLN